MILTQSKTLHADIMRKYSQEAFSGAYSRKQKSGAKMRPGAEDMKNSAVHTEIDPSKARSTT